MRPHLPMLPRSAADGGRGTPTARSRPARRGERPWLEERVLKEI